MGESTKPLSFQVVTAMLYQPALTQPRSLHQRRIDELMLKAGQALPTTPTIPDEATRLLRAKLIMEEALETIDALGISVGARLCSHEPDTDLYEGLVFENLSFMPQSILEETGRISPSSLTEEERLCLIADGCADLSVVTIGTLSACGIADIPILEAVDENNLQKFGPGGYRREDGKWVKPPGHKPPDLRSLIITQMGK